MKFFLDIDGVMVHANPHKRVEFDEDGFYKFNSVAVETLNSVINQNGDDELILSTSHRFRFTVMEWEIMLNRRGIFAKKISILNLPLAGRLTRKAEIMNWISERNLSPGDIVIIDDDKSLNDLPAPLKKRLVLTNPYTGLNGSSDLNKVLSRQGIGFHKKAVQKR